MTIKPPSSRPLRADAVQNHSRIVGAAGDLFRARGLDAPLEDIARAAGVGIGTLYRRFPDRESLILAVFEQKAQQTIDMAHAALIGGDPWTEFHTLLMFMFRIVAEDKGMREHFIGSRYTLNLVTPVRDVVVSLLGSAIKNAQSNGTLRPDVTAHDIPPLMLMVGVVADFGSSTNPNLWERYSTLLIDGLRIGADCSALPQNSLTASEMRIAMRLP